MVHYVLLLYVFVQNSRIHHRERKQGTMVRAAIRALFGIATLGIVMSLMVYGGRISQFKETGKVSPANRSIYQTSTGDYLFSYQVVDASQTIVPCQSLPYALSLFSHSSRLVLFITDPSGNEVTDAKVRYRIEAPGNSFFEVGGFFVEGGYAASVQSTATGVYRIEAEIELPDQHLPVVNNFSFHGAL